LPEVIFGDPGTRFTELTGLLPDAILETARTWS